MAFSCTIYNACFFLYVFSVPAFLQYLMHAPSTFNNMPFHPVPLQTLEGKVVKVNMSNPPQTMEEGVNHCKPCYEDQYHKMGMYQWDIMLRMSYADLVKQTRNQPVSTMYPVILASNDFKNWRVVADADDVAGDLTEKEIEKPGTNQPTHISPPLLIAKLKPFGCVDNETGTTDPFMWFFASAGKARLFKWKLVEHISRHGAVNLVACVMQGFGKVNKVLTHYAQNCVSEDTMSCVQTPREALGQCYALGSACGQACGYFSPTSGHCRGGELDPELFQGLTTKRVNIKTSLGGGASNSLVYCAQGGCKTGLHFQGMYVEAENPNDFVEGAEDSLTGDYYTIVFAMADVADSTAKLANEIIGGGEEAETTELASHHSSNHHPSTPGRRLDANTKYVWQIASTPNLTMGVFKDHSSNTMRIRPAKESCYTQPGFTYMVACMTSKPVFISGQMMDTAGPPFNDRCLAVGGICGAACGSGETLDEDALKHCPLHSSRRLGLADDSPYASVSIPMDSLVAPIEARKSATTKSAAAAFFFNGFIFFVTISYLATILSKFPGNFTDFYPMHTWDEIKTHGYLLEKFGCAVAFGVSAGEDKMIVFRNWVGKIASRPEFDDAAFPTFRKWVDVFADEGHREGARLLWVAWSDFLDTSPPLAFLEEWSKSLRDMSWEQAHSRSPFDIAWQDGKPRKVLPVVAHQAMSFVRSVGEEIPEGGVELQQDSLARLQDLAEMYKRLPANLRMEPSLSKKDDCVLTREVRLGLLSDSQKNRASWFAIKYSKNWKQEVEAKIKERAQSAFHIKSVEAYKKLLVVSDCNGRTMNYDNISCDAAEALFPLLFREPPAHHRDRKVIMIYMARAKPEGDRRGIERTRGLDKYLWACLRPSAVQPYTGDGGTRRKFKRQRQTDGEKQPLLQCEAASVKFNEVRNMVHGVLDRQHMAFLETIGESNGSGSSNAKSGIRGHRDLAEAYLQYRRVESDWEMGRFCYGEIVGEDVDPDNEEALILDNPSPALLELVSSQEFGGNGSGEDSKGMGLVALHKTKETDFWCTTRDAVRVAYAAKPGLEFLFSPIEDDCEYKPKKFEWALRQDLRRLLQDQSTDVSRIAIKQTQQGCDIFADVTGPASMIEEIRDRMDGILMVGKFQGRLMDNHPTVLVKKRLLMPYIGVRGKGGGLNYAVDVLQFRDGFIGTGEEQDPIAQRMLFGIFDARHTPHSDFWRMVLPKFMQNTSVGFTYEVNQDVAMVQAPQHFAGLKAESDVLDILNGAAFNIMNVIRNRCGGVTSCGTNAVWQVDAAEFSRQLDDDVLEEYFESRTKIEDTATTHLHFCKGKRSVYVHEIVCTGIAKVNADYLGAVQRWAEGAVQLFWVQLFVDKTWQLVLFGWCCLAYLGFHFWLLYGTWTKPYLGYNIFCDVGGEATIVFGPDSEICQNIYHGFSAFLGHDTDRVVYKMAEHQYMLMIDITLTWLVICCMMMLSTMYLSMFGVMPKIVRIFIMTENITYFWTSLGTFFWLSLTVFMVVSSSPPLMFNVSHFALYVLCIRIAEHGMLNYYKALGESNELSIWRGQQSYMISAPLYVMSIVQGTLAAWGIYRRGSDKSFWNSSDHGSDVIRIATIWVTLIWGMLFCCVAFTAVMATRYDLFHDVQDKFERQCQICACFMMALMAITVWEPLCNFWGFETSIDALSKDESRTWVRWWAGFNVWWRSRAWMLRYVIDFGLPLLILSGVTGAMPLISVIMYSCAAQGMRI